MKTIIAILFVAALIVQATPVQAAPAQSTDRPIRVGGNVMAANLVKKVAPAYPADMKAQGLQATVQLETTISKEGVPESFNVIGADVNQSFIEASIEAVKQWRYKPVLLNGQPVEVITVVTINFTLSQ